MINIRSNDINEIYAKLCNALIMQGQDVGNTKELTNVSFTLTDLDNNIVGIRNISKSYLFGELLWYMTAREDMAFINKFAGMWGRISDNGVTSNSAYGHILFKRHGFNQVQKIIDLLKHDKNSRRAVLNFNVPNINVIETKDEICTIALQLYIRDNKLYCTGIMRSNDIWFGTPYDVAFFTELQKFIAHRLDVEVGSYTHFVVSMHVYDRNYRDMNLASKCIPTTRIHLDIEKLYDKKDKLDMLICNFSENPKQDIIKFYEDEKVFEEVRI